MHKKTYTLVFVLGILFFGLSGILWYGISSVITLKNEENALRGEFQSWVRRSKQMSSFYNTLEEAKRIKEATQEYYFVPTEENQILLISGLERAVRESGAKGEVKSLDVSSDYTKVAGGISLSGDWNSVFHALLSLEAYPIGLSLNDIAITEERSSANDVLVSASSTPKTIYRANIQFSITNIRKPE